MWGIMQQFYKNCSLWDCSNFVDIFGMQNEGCFVVYRFEGDRRFIAE